MTKFDFMTTEITMFWSGNYQLAYVT